MHRSVARLVSLISIFLLPLVLSGQTIPDVLDTGTQKEQFDYIQQRTRIYENYRAIREDMFQKLIKNANDSLDLAKRNISEALTHGRVLSSRIDSLNNVLSSTTNELEQVKETKDAINVFGLNLNKITYNLIMLAIIGALAALLILGYMAYLRNRAITTYTKREFEDLKNEFETYRKESREAREKLVMTHFNEVKRLKGM